MKLLPNKRANLILTLWKLTLASMLVLSCSTAPINQQSQLPQDTSSGFKIKSIVPTRCYQGSWFDSSQSISTRLSGRLHRTWTRYNPSGWDDLDAQLQNGKLRVAPLEDGNFVLQQASAKAYSGPYGYHLDAINQSIVIPGPIHPGDQRQVTYSGGSYRFGDSSATTFSLSGNVSLTFGLDQITVSISGSGPMTESAYYNLPVQPKYSEGSIDSISGDMTFGPPSWGDCPGVEVSADPEAISPANQDGEFDTTTFHVKSTAGLPWTLTVEGNKLGPLDAEGLPTKGDACSWSSTGSEAEKDIEWNGKCGDGTYMVDGEYQAKITSEDSEDVTTIKLDNTLPIVTDIQLHQKGDDIEVTATATDPVINGFASGVDTQNKNDIEFWLDGEPVQVASTSIFDSDGFQVASNSGVFTISASIPGRTLNDQGNAYVGIPDKVKNKGTANQSLPIELELEITPMTAVPLKDKQSSATLATKSDVKITVKRGDSPAKDISVDIEALQPHDGFHDHTNGDKQNRPRGVFMESGNSKLTRKTDSNGEVKLKYRNSGFAGIETIVAKLSSDSSKKKEKDVKDVTVKLGGLVDLPASPLYDLVGTDSSVGKNHLKNHYGTAKLVGDLQAIANEFHSKTNFKLAINDMSLPWGGPFEIDGNWNLFNRHSNHREGNSADISRHNLKNSASRKAFEDASIYRKWNPWAEDSYHYHIYPL